MAELWSKSRLELLARLEVLDLPREEAYDRITRLARRVLRVPVALMTVVHETRQLFKSQDGLVEPWATRRETPLSHSLCHSIVRDERPLVVGDARRDAELRESLAIPELGVVAHLGVPLVVRGEVLGALCVIAHEPREWVDEEVALLDDLARIAAAEMELRLAASDAAERTAALDRERAAKDAVLASVRDAVCVVSAAGRCTFANDVAGELLATGRGGLVGRELPLVAQAAGGDGQPPRSAIAAALEGETVQEADATLRRANGAQFEVDLSCAPIHLVDGVAGAVVSFRDVTARRRDQALIEAQTAVLEAIAAGRPLAQVLDMLARLIEARIPGLLCSILLVDDEKRLRHGAAPSLPAAFCAAIDGTEIGPEVGSCGTAAYHDQLVIVADMRESPLWARFDELAAGHGLRACWSTPVHSAVGEVIGTFALYYRERRTPSQFERRLIQIGGHLAGIAIDRARREEALAEASRRKDEFLAVLAHELRNPLAPIRTGLELMQLRGETEAVRERAVIERQTRHLMRLVDDLLDISRVTRGKVSLKKEPLELRTLVAHAVETASPLFDERRHRVTVAGPHAPVHVLGDQDRLTQVVANLLTNAARYTAPGGHVHVTVTAQGDEATIRVRDDGMGIAAELQRKMFEAFVQGERSHERHAAGLGLGLALARSLARLHGGDVAAHSEGPGRGSEFVVTLPRLFVVREASATATPRPRRADGRRVLVVDDNADAAALLAEALELQGYTTKVAFDGPEALEIAARFEPEVALLDIGLPLMDGIELGRRLVARAPHAPPLLIAISGYGQESDLERTRAAGFCAHFVKPVDLSALVERLEASTPEAGFRDESPEPAHA